MTKGMIRLFDWCVYHPGACLGIAFGITACLSLGLTRFEIDGSNESLWPANDPDVAYYRDVQANFESDNVISVGFRSEDIFQPGVLKGLRNLSFEMERIEGVDQVFTLFNQIVLKREKENVLFEPLFKRIPESPEELNSLREEAISNPFLRGLYVNDDGTACAIQVLLSEQARRLSLEQKIVEEIHSLIEKEEARNSYNGSFYTVGLPVLRTSASNNIRYDMLVLGPITLLCVAAVIYFAFRSFIASILPFLSGLLSVVSTLGFVGAIGFEVNVLFSLIVILVAVVGCTEDIHILAEYARISARGKQKEDAVAALGRTIGKAVVITTISTILGFLTAGLNPIVGIREFAIGCSVGIALNFVFTILLVPALLPHIREPRMIVNGGRLVAAGEVIQRGLSERTRVISFGIAAVVALSVAGVFRLNIDTDFMRMYSKESKTHRDLVAFSQDFGGISFFFVTIETGKRNGIYDVDVVQQVAAFHEKLGRLTAYSFGLTDVLRELGRYDLEDPGGAITQEKLNRYRADFGGNFLAPHVDYDGSRTVIRTGVDVSGSMGIRKVTREIAELAAAELPSGFEVRVVGESVLTSRIADEITENLLRSLVILIVGVTILLSFFFRSAKLGLISFLPNAFPILTTFGFMGWVGIPLSVGTFPVALVSFGLAVDDTIHFIARFRKLERVSELQTFSSVLKRTCSMEVFPIVTTSCALVLGFSVMLFSGFHVQKEMGVLFVMAIISALIADLLVLPLLLRWGYASKRSQGKGTGQGGAD